MSNPTRRTPEERGAQGPGSLIPASYDTVLTWPDHSAASVGQLGRAGRPSRGGEEVEEEEQVGGGRIVGSRSYLWGANMRADEPSV